MRQFYVHVNISCKLHFKVISTNIDYLYIYTCICEFLTSHETFYYAANELQQLNIYLL